MAPEPEILKRKRSRPSDWWAAAPTTPQQQEEPPAKKRGGASNSNADGKGIKDAPAAGNRGKSAKGKEVARDGENGEEDELQQKPMRRGRSSGGGEELLGGDGSSSAAKRVEVKKRKVAQEVNEDQSTSKKGRRRLALAQDEEQAEDTVIEKPMAKTRGRPSAGRAEGIHEAAGTSKQSKSQRRGRPSNTEVGVLAATQPMARNVEQKRSRHPAAEKEVEAELDEDDEDPIAPQKRRLPRKRADADGPIDELVGSDLRKKKKRRSGVEMLEAEALALTTTEHYSKGRPRPAISKVVSSPDDQERGRKRTRHSDVHSQDIRPATSSIIEQQGKGQARTRQSVADPQEAAIAGPSKISKNNLHRDPRVEVETASSRLQRSGPKKGVKPLIEKRSKPAKGSSAAEQSQRNKKRTRSSNEKALERVIPEPSKVHKKASKGQSHEDNQSRKRKGVDERPESPPEKRRRTEKPARQSQVSPEPEEVPVYQHLQAVTHRVSRQTIDAKWEPLPSNCVEQISQLLQDLQRPVVVRYNDERKKTQSSTALQMISRRLVSKISKGLPFPQGTRNHREDDFDFEKILDYNRALEAQLTPALHANELLVTQVSKELELLESERERLAILEANAKTTAASRSEAARRLHWLLQPSQGLVDVEEMKDDVGLSIAQLPRPLDLSFQDDKHLQALGKDLHDHVESIQGNIRQVEGISQAIHKSKAAVQATLFDHLESVQYDEVVLGSE